MSIYKDYTPPSSDGGGFLKIKDGETVVIRIASEPVIFQSEYQGQFSTRYGWVIYNLTADAAQIFTNSATFFRNLAAYATDEDYGDVTEYNIKVTRQGEGTDTKYTIVPSPKKAPLTDEQKAAVERVDILKAIDAAPSSSLVFWLSDFIKQDKKEQTGYEKARATADSFRRKDDDQDLGKEVSLDDVPF